MRKLILIGLLSALTLFGQQDKKGAATSKVHVLTVAEFDQLFAKPDQLLIIDVRRPDEIASGGEIGRAHV